MPFRNLKNHCASLSIIHVLVLFSGMAALSWEVVWQLKSTLALGVSAWGTAVTLAVTMGGMSLGAIIAGNILRGRESIRPLRLYAVLEIIIGISGLFLGAIFAQVEQIDSWVYTNVPDYATLVHIAGIVAALGLPACAMGATLPVLGLAARQFETSLALLYGLNTFGAALGTLLVAFLWIPLLGVAHVILLISGVNLAVALIALKMDRGEIKTEGVSKKKKAAALQPIDPRIITVLVFVTGFATFMLEVAWFRSMRAAFFSTTSAFAVMLACVLTALAIGAAFAPILKKRNVNLGLLVCWAGILIIGVTPAVERFDMFMYSTTLSPFFLFLRWYFLSLYIIGGPIILLGTALPWILDDQDTPRRWGMLYGLNAFAAILGSVFAAWVFLPQLGFAATSWLSGGILLCAGMPALLDKDRKILPVIGVCALCFAVFSSSGLGRERIQGSHIFGQKHVILKSYEGPDSTVSAVEYEDGMRSLFIDGFVATLQSDNQVGEHYMAWMGHLPMLMHPDPQNALVICFGTGQTANAVRKENPARLDVVDINANVLKLAEYFPANEGVLDDERVHTTVMDGRVYMRRTKRKYDVVTMEPMPPSFAGVNALYSKEFYETAKAHMSESGIIAQWLPFHLVPEHYSYSIVKTFREVFPNSILWVDPSTTGILIGAVDESMNLLSRYPGLKRPGIERDLSNGEIRRAVLLDQGGMKEFGSRGEIITDDNQLLAYGKSAYMVHGLKRTNTIDSFRTVGKIKPFDWNDIWDDGTEKADSNLVME